MNQGFVTHYNANRGFGFILDEETKDSVFFHCSQYGKYWFNGGDFPTFLPADPSAGLKVVYQREVGPKGPIAKAVGTVNSYKAAHEQIGTRLEYRFIRRTGSHPRRRLYTGDEYKYEVLWQGKNLLDLRSKHPAKWDTKHIGKKNTSNGQWCWYFEYANAEGVWEECGDPR